MHNQEFQREHLEESMAALGITLEIRTFKLLQKPTQSPLHKIIAANWMAEVVNSLGKGGWLADDCGTGKVGPYCAHEIHNLPH